MVLVIDYRAGNLYNVGHALRRLGADFQFSGKPEEVAAARRVILPGQGAARTAMDSLREQGLVEVLGGLKVPFLGICLGLQLLFEHSAEENTDCLGVFPGAIGRFDSSKVKVPQIGWNRVHLAEKRPPDAPQILRGIPDGAHFYFAHSYYAPVVDDLTIGVAEYSVRFSAVVARDNFFGVQFHPERSGETGLRLLRNFLGDDL